MSYVYRFLDKDYKILYVGYTSRNSVLERLDEHFGNKGHLDKECYNKVCRIDYKQYSNNKLGLNAEKKYIKHYAPVYNVVHKPKNKTPKTVYMMEDWRTIKEFDTMNEIPKYYRWIQILFLIGFITFGLSSISYMIYDVYFK